MPFEPVSPLGGFTGLAEPREPERFTDVNPETRPFQETPSVMDAAFRTENTVGSSVASEEVRYTRAAQGEFSAPVKIDPDYDPWADIVDTKYETYADNFALAGNRDHANAIKADIDRETKDRDTIAKSGWTGIGASMAAGVLDLPILLPGGNLVRTAKGGVSLLRTAGSTAVYGTAAAIASETVLHGSQQLRTGEESAMVIGGSTVLAGLLGAGFGKLFSRAEQAAFAARVERDFTIPGHGEPDHYTPGGVQAEPEGIAAFHASPYEFSQFDMNRINTGEGSQMFGRGLYFSQEGKVGKAYFEQFTRSHGTAHLYEVQIKAHEDELMDWDKPFAQQPEKVKSALREIGVDPKDYPTATAEDLVQGIEKFKAKRTGVALLEAQKAAIANPTGETLKRFRDLEAKASEQINENKWNIHDPEGVAKALQSAGVPGIQYYDQLSRGAGKGTRNIVVFDDKLVKITKKNGKPLPTRQIDLAPGASPKAASVADIIRQTAEEILPPQVRVQVADKIDLHTGEGKYAIKAYHGTPHDVDEFDLSKIGTGEGAQAFGHGLYFAEKEGVARSYQNQLSTYTANGKPLGEDMSLALGAHDGDVTSLLKERQGQLDRWLASGNTGKQTDSIVSSLKQDVKKLTALQKQKIEKSGHLYEVDLDVDHHQLLDWDKPLNQQSPDVQAKLNEILKPSGRMPEEWIKHSPGAEQRLREAGIPGIRYLDQGSRDAAEGTRNIVIFDDKLVKITKKNGEPVTAAERKAVTDEMFGVRKDIAGGGEDKYGLRGFYSPGIRAAEAISQERGTGEQFWKQITKVGGVRKDELDWMGLEEFLKDKPSVTKTEVLDFMKAHQVELDEKVLGDTASEKSVRAPVTMEQMRNHLRKDADELPDDAYQNIESIRLGEEQVFIATGENQSGTGTRHWVLGSDDEIIGDASSREAAVHIAEGYLREGLPDATKFHGYKVPGGENYRELLVRLPELGARGLTVNEKARLDALNAESRRLFESPLNETDVQRKGRHARIGEISKEARQVAELQDPKYTSKHFIDQEIVHLRVDDRVGPNGEKVLFVNEVQSDLHQQGRTKGYKPKNAEAIQKEIATLEGQYAKNVDRLHGLTGQEQADYAREVLALDDKIKDLKNQVPEMPNAPFKGDLWLELALKRALLYASENGYDAVSWARSDQIAKAVGAQADDLKLQYDSKIGKFYDKYTKKWGAKVEEAAIADGDNSLLRITPEMRASVMEGQPLSLRGGQGAPVAEGRFDPEKLLITISADALDPVKTLKHESIHALRTMGLFADKEWGTLEAAARKQGWVESNNVRALYEDLYSGRKGDEQFSLLSSFFSKKKAPSSEPITATEMKVYHGTSKKFTKFDKSKSPDRAVFFSSNSKTAEGFLDPEIPGQVIPVFVETKKFKTIQSPGHWAANQHEIPKAKKEGYHGLVIKNVRDETGYSGDFDEVITWTKGTVRHAITGDRMYSVRGEGKASTGPLDPKLENMLLEEAIAEQFSLWRQGAIQVTGAVAKLFQRIKDFLDRIGNALRGQGFQTADDVFASVRGGDVAGRAAPVQNAQMRAPVVRPLTGKEFFEQHADADPTIFDRIPFLDHRELERELVFPHVKDGKVVGATAIEQSPSDPDVYWSKFTSVDESYRNQGIAKALVQQKLDFVRSEGKLLKLSTRTDDGEKFLDKLYEGVPFVFREGEPKPPLPGRAALAAGSGRGASVGAAAREAVDNTLKPALGLEKVRVDPLIYLQNSKSEKTRTYIQELAETPLAYKKNAKGYETAPLGSEMGEPGAVESRIKMWQAPLAEGVQTLENAFMRYRKGRDAQMFDQMRTTIGDALSKPEKLTWRQFKEEVSFAFRRGDRHATIPEVAQTAKFARDNVFNPLKDRAIAKQLLPEDISVETAESYLNRMYNKEKIIARRPEFKAIVEKEWLDQVEFRNGVTRAQLAPLLDEVERMKGEQKKVEPRIAKREQRLKELETAAEEVGKFNKFVYERAGKRREPIDQLRQRVSDLTSQVAEPLDTLKNIRGITAELSEARKLAERSAEETGTETDLAYQLANAADLEERLSEIVSKAEANVERIAETGDLPAPKTNPALAHDEIDEIATQWQFAKEMRAKRKPESLTRFVIREGGVEDPGGDVLSMIGRKKDRPGLVRRGPDDGGPALALGGNATERTNTLDAMALRAWENGFFPQLTERPTINQFLDAINRDLTDGRIVRADDSSYFDDLAKAEQIERDLEKQGVSLDKFSTEGKVRLALGQSPSDAFQGEAKAGIKSLNAVQAQLREALAPYRNRLKTLVQQEKTTSRKEGIASTERGVFATRIRSRGNTLADQISGRTAELDTMRSDLALRNERITDSQKQIEALVLKYEGKTKAEAESAVKAREKAEIERDPTAKRLTSADKPIIRAAKKIVERVDKEAGETASLADEIIDRILGTPDGRLPYDAHLNRTTDAQGVSSSARGPLAARTFMIPDELIEDFLENDFEMLMHAYVRTMAPDVELHARFGDVDMKLQMKEIQEDWAKKASAATSEKERKSLHAQRNGDIKRLAAIRDRLRGTYALPSDPDGLLLRTGRVMRSVNYMAMLGGQVASAIPDMGSIVFSHGIMRTFGDGIIPLFRNFSGARMAMGEVKLAGTALDMVLDSRAMNIGEIMDDYGRHSKFERGVQSLTRNFGPVSLMSPWNAAMKQTAGLITMSRIIKASDALRRDVITKPDLERLAASGISPANAKKIAEQFKKHGEKDGGVYLPKTENWDADARAAKEAFRVALVREVDKTIITPGQEKWLWMSTELGRTLGQFKSFSVSANQRLLIAGLQQRDMGTLSGAALMVALGGLVHILKTKAGGRDPGIDWSDNEKTSQFMVNAVDRSGLLGWLMEANAVSEKVTGGQVGLSKLTGRPISRYASRNLAGAMAGPTFGTLQSIGQVSSAGFTEWKETDTRAARRLLPYQNLFYVRSLFDKAEEGVNSYFGVPKTATRR